uniref:Reverse transcriptase Ty1/copia-type domain-containing protein n=1 Tax=Ananas comosus var. bracteatus TaxID=296719 RepID=A0A6V7QVN2_ANACO
MLIVCKDKLRINELKSELSKAFEVKDLGPARQILGIEIWRDRQNGTLSLSQKEFVEKLVCKFGMSKAKVLKTPFAYHFKLSSEQSPKTEEEKKLMNRVPYSSVVGSLMFAMVCTHPDIAYAVGVLSRFMANPERCIRKRRNGFFAI